MSQIRRMIAVVALIAPMPLLAQSVMFRGGPDHRGEYLAPGVPAFGGLAWRVQTLGPVRSSPTIVGETAFIGSSDGHVYAIDVSSGDVKWRRHLSSPVMSTPAVYRDLLLVGTYDGTMHALRTRTGNSAWQHKTGAPAALRWGFESGETWTSSATVLGGVAVFGARDGFVYAVNARTGARLWRYAAGARVVS